jgi:hypothetical protein
MMQSRPYKTEVVDTILAAYAHGVQQSLGPLPVGIGQPTGFAWRMLVCGPSAPSQRGGWRPVSAGVRRCPGSALRASGKPPRQGGIAVTSTVAPCCPHAHEARGPREVLPVDLLRSTNV